MLHSYIDIWKTQPQKMSVGNFIPDSMLLVTYHMKNQMHQIQRQYGLSAHLVLLLYRVNYRRPLVPGIITVLSNLVTCYIPPKRTQYSSLPPFLAPSLAGFGHQLLSVHSLVGGI